MIRLEMQNYNMILKEKQQKALSSGRIYKYEYLTGEQILPSDRRAVIEQAKFTYSPLGKALEKQRKATEDQGRKKNRCCNKSKRKTNSFNE